MPVFRAGFDLPNVSRYIAQGSSVISSVVDYINDQMKVSIDWDDAAKLVEEWGGPFAVKGVMSVDDAKRCVEIGASAIMISNHGGRQLESTPAPVESTCRNDSGIPPPPPSAAPPSPAAIDFFGMS